MGEYWSIAGRAKYSKGDSFFPGDKENRSKGKRWFRRRASDSFLFERRGSETSGLTCLSCQSLSRCCIDETSEKCRSRIRDNRPSRRDCEGQRQARHPCSSWISPGRRPLVGVHLLAICGLVDKGEPGCERRDQPQESRISSDVSFLDS